MNGVESVCDEGVCSAADSDVDLCEELGVEDCRGEEEEEEEDDDEEEDNSDDGDGGGGDSQQGDQVGKKTFF